jgi:predicted O-linked N-acetylglucosamine transferase (SPINDLY family)
VFPRIAKELGSCRFVFIEDPRSESDISPTFRRRLGAAFEMHGLRAEDYCIFRPHMSREAFAGMCAAADVFLDSIGWSGCNTALETMGHGLPVVTLPGEMMRGRHVFAMLKLMGVEETIAKSKDDYIRIATRLGREPEFRRNITEQVTRNRHKLYRDEAPVRALEALIETELLKRQCLESVEAQSG